jgi:hypothetical protein
MGFHLGWYHAEWTFIMVHFLLIFLPTSESLSLASLIKRRVANDVAEPTTPTVPIGCYLVPVYLALGLLYVDSVIWKLDSWHWIEGLGVWRPMSTLSAAQSDFTPLLNVKPLMVIASWVTIAYEFGFVVLMWFRRARVPLAIVGIGLHLGILIAFPIPIFGLQSLLILSLLIPTWPNWIASKIGRREAPAGYPARWVPPFKPSLAAVGILTTAQVVITLALSVSAWLNFTPPAHLAAVAQEVRKVTKPYFGITTHDVFVAGHFDGNSRIYRLVARPSGRPVPIVDESGMPAHMLSRDLFWCAWVFFNLRDNPTEGTLVRYAANHLGPDRLRSGNRYAFDVQVKDFTEARHWRKNVLRDAKTAPWLDVGVLTFDNGAFAFKRERIASP